MASDFRILWTEEAIKNLEGILNYLNNRWTQREIDNFKNKLSRQISLIKQNPILFPVSQYNIRLRKAVLSRQTTIFYEITGKTIYLVYIFSNMQDIEKII